MHFTTIPTPNLSDLQKFALILLPKGHMEVYLWKSEFENSIVLYESHRKQWILQSDSLIYQTFQNLYDYDHKRIDFKNSMVQVYNDKLKKYIGVIYENTDDDDDYLMNTTIMHKMRWSQLFEFIGLMGKKSCFETELRVVKPVLKIPGTPRKKKVVSF